MTKKDYQLIAGVLKQSLADDQAIMQLHQNALTATAKAMAEALAAENPRFDRTKFLEACGVTL